MLPVITLEGSLRDLDVKVKSRGFFIHKRINYGYHVRLCQVGAISIKGTFSNSTLVPCVSVKMREKHRCICGTKFAAIHLGQIVCACLP